MQQNSMKIKQKQKVISTEEYLMKKGLLYQNRSEEQIKSITIPQNCIVMELEMLYVEKNYFSGESSECFAKR